MTNTLRLSGLSGFFSSGFGSDGVFENFGGETLMEAMLANSIANSRAGIKRNMMFRTGSKSATISSSWYFFLRIASPPFFVGVQIERSGGFGWPFGQVRSTVTFSPGAPARRGGFPA